MEEMEDLLTVEEAATRLNVPQSTIKKWIQDRKMKTITWSRGYTTRQPSYLIPLKGNEPFFDPKPQDHSY